MPVSLPPRHLAALCATTDALDRARVRWVLAGSAGRALLGCPVRARDIDVEVEPGGAAPAGAAIGAVLAESGGDGRRSLRASVERAGIEVDLTGDLSIEAPGGRLAPDFERQWAFSHPVTVCGRSIRVAPLEEVICRAIILADWAHVATISGQAARAHPALRLDAGYVGERLSSASASATR